MKVLHIDDSPEICELYQDMFIADNHSIISVKDGKNGIKLAVNNEFDLILLDMCMPKYSGLDFLRDLKSQRPSELKKVVVVSVLEFNADQTKELLEFGVHSIEKKPPNLSSLVNMQKNMVFK